MSHSVEVLQGEGDHESRPWIEATRTSLDGFAMDDRLVKCEGPWGDRNQLAGRVFILSAFLHSQSVVVLECTDDDDESSSDTEHSSSGDDKTRYLLLDPSYWAGWLRLPDDIQLTATLSRLANLSFSPPTTDTWRLLFIALVYRRLARIGVHTAGELTDGLVFVPMSTYVAEVLLELQSQ